MRLLERPKRPKRPLRPCLNPYSTGNEVVGFLKTVEEKAANKVLILILLEMRLLVKIKLENFDNSRELVLILILLEMRLLGRVSTTRESLSNCLNPYSTGNEVVGCSEEHNIIIHSSGLNPYSTGNEVVGIIYQERTYYYYQCLNPYSTGNEVVGITKDAIKHLHGVLILILLEMRLLE